MKHSKLDKMFLLLSDARGVYIPANFKECFDMKRWNVKDSDSADISSVDNEFYWEAWDSVLNSAFFIATESDDMMKGKWTLYQNGELWAIHESFTDEEWEDFAS
jgi:hypothetical protein